MTRSWYRRVEKKLHISKHELKPLQNLTNKRRTLKFALCFSFASMGPQKAKYCQGSSFARLEVAATKNIRKIILHHLNCKVLMLKGVPGNTSVTLPPTEALPFFER